MIGATGPDDVLPLPVRRGLVVHGVLDLAFAALYGAIGLFARGRSVPWNVALAAVCASLAIAGALLLVRPRAGRRVALLSQSLLLAFAAVTLVGLAASAGYLRGVYGPIGQGLALASLVAAALVVELAGLLPLFQLRFLTRADVVSALDPSCVHRRST